MITASKRTGGIVARAGSQALSLLANPLSTDVLRALADGPLSLLALRRAVGSPPQTTLRAQLRSLAELGVLRRTRQSDFPGSVDYELTRPGRELLAVARVTAAWLAVAPDGPVSLGSTAAKSAIKALVDGWSTSMMRALAARPLSLTELDSLIAGVSYPSLERRLAAMRLVGQVEKKPGKGKGTPYAATGWLRRAIGPLAASIRWEGRNLDGTAVPPTNRDVEAAFLLALPLVELPSDLSGSCRLAVELRGDNRGAAGALVEVDEGRLVSCRSRLQGSATAWATGTAAAWLEAVIERERRGLEIGGDGRLAGVLLDGLHKSLLPD